MSGKRGSNPRPSAWEADALPLSYSRLLSCSRALPTVALAKAGGRAVVQSAKILKSSYLPNNFRGL